MQKMSKQHLYIIKGHVPCKETLTTLIENGDSTISVVSEKSVSCAIYSRACSETGDVQVFYIKVICILNIKIICKGFLLNINVIHEQKLNGMHEFDQQV